MVTLLLRFVSGIPILEKNFEKREGWAQYKAETNVFIPWLPKRNVTLKHSINEQVDDRKIGFNSSIVNPSKGQESRTNNKIDLDDT